MRRSIHRLLLVTTFLVIVASCSKNKDDAAAPTDYSPLTTGSTWTYQNNTGGSYTLTATSRDTVALGRTYKVLTSTSGPNNYRAKSGADYYRFGVVPGFGTTGYEELYLKDGQAVNAVWQTTQNLTVPGIPVPIAAVLKYTIKELGITRTVAGKAYSNVLHVRLDITAGLFGSAGGGDFYYAKGIGLIESSILLTVQGQTLANATETLTAYTIK